LNGMPPPVVLSSADLLLDGPDIHSAWRIVAFSLFTRKTADEMFPCSSIVPILVIESIIPESQAALGG
jgi:hypothetical protein